MVVLERSVNHQFARTLYIVRSKSAKGHNECCSFDFKFKGECCVMLIKKKPSIKPCFMYYVKMVRHFDSVSNPGGRILPIFG